LNRQQKWKLNSSEMDCCEIEMSDRTSQILLDSTNDRTNGNKAGMKHTGWGWWFAREEGGEWVLVGQGY